jgi:hypothetical protein
MSYFVGLKALHAKLRFVSISPFTTLKDMPGLLLKRTYEGCVYKSREESNSFSPKKSSFQDFRTNQHATRVINVTFVLN